MEIRIQDTEPLENMESPVVRGNGATFRYRNPYAQSVSFAADSTGWQPAPMERAGDDWTLTRVYPEDARDEYLFVVDGAYILDPWNPVRRPSPFGPHSECLMPKYSIRPVELPADGKMEHHILADRLVNVYVPAQAHGAALLVVQDGYEYAWFTGMPGLLDGLIREGAIPPTLVVFVAPLDRNAEYRANDEYVGWLADELVPAVVERYPIDPHPDRHGLIGASLGGLIATYGAIRRPDVFRLVGAQSPAYRRQDMESLLRHADEADWSSLRIHADGGTLEETLYGREFLPSIRRGIATFEKKGCDVAFVEVNEGHNWTSWRGRLPRMLSWLLAPE